MTGHYSIGNPGLTLSDFQIQNTGDANASNLVVTFAVDNGIVTPNANNGWSCGPPASVVTCSFDGVLVPGAGATGANNASVTFPQ